VVRAPHLHQARGHQGDGAHQENVNEPAHRRGADDRQGPDQQQHHRHHEHRIHLARLDLKFPRNETSRFNVSPIPVRSTRKGGPVLGASWHDALVVPRRRGEARRFFQINLVVLAVAAGFALMYRFANALFILFVGIAIGMAVKPGVEWLRRRGVPRNLGALMLYLALGGAFAGSALLITPAITDGMSALVARGPRQLETLRERMAASESSTLRHLADARLPTRAPSKLEPGKVVTYTGAFGRNLASLAAVLVLGFYWTLEGDRRVRVLALFAPFGRRRAILAFIGEVERTVGAYLRGQSLVCLLIGLMAFGIYRSMGLPHATALGLLYAVGEAVPVVGPIVGTT